MNCPVNERTADGDLVGRCWFHLPDGRTCPRHGDVGDAVEFYRTTGRLTPEPPAVRPRGDSGTRRTDGDA